MVTEDHAVFVQHLLMLAYTMRDDHKTRLNLYIVLPQLPRSHSIVLIKSSVLYG